MREKINILMWKKTPFSIGCRLNDENSGSHIRNTSQKCLLPRGYRILLHVMVYRTQRRHIAPGEKTKNPLNNNTINLRSIISSVSVRYTIPKPFLHLRYFSMERGIRTAPTPGKKSGKLQTSYPWKETAAYQLSPMHPRICAQSTVWHRTPCSTGLKKPGKDYRVG